MTVPKIVRRFPFLTLGVVSWLIVILPWLLGSEYDDNPVATLLFLIGQLLGVVFHLLGVIVVHFTGIRPGWIENAAISVLGLSIYLAVDLAFARRRRRE